MKSLLKVVLVAFFIIAWTTLSAAVFNFVNVWLGIAFFMSFGLMLWKACDYLFDQIDQSKV